MIRAGSAVAGAGLYLGGTGRVGAGVETPPQPTYPKAVRELVFTGTCPACRQVCDWTATLMVDRSDKGYVVHDGGSCPCGGVPCT